MLRDSTEIDEIRHPIRVVADRIQPDTEGAGRRRGAPAAFVEYGPVGCTIEVMWCSDGSVNPAAGAHGGGPGATARQFKREHSGELTELEPWGRIALEPGETVVSISSGGGGFGPPHERDVERVRHDVAEGWVTREGAASRYGVVIDDTGAVDATATAARRDALRLAAQEA
jgi:N-methylhydantoinase B